MRVESSSGSCRGRRKENLYEGSWREFERCARFITPITERRGGDPSLIYRDARLEKAPNDFPRNRGSALNATRRTTIPGWNIIEPETRFRNNRRTSGESCIVVYHAGIRVFLSFCSYTRVYKILRKLRFEHDNKFEITSIPITTRSSRKPDRFIRL